MMFLPLSRRSRPASAASSSVDGANPIITMPSSSSSPATIGSPTAAVPDKEAAALSGDDDKNCKPKSSFSFGTTTPPLPLPTPPLLPPPTPTVSRSSLPLLSSSTSNYISNSNFSSPTQNPLTATLRPPFSSASALAGGATTTAVVGDSGSVSQNHNNQDDARYGGGGEAGGGEGGGVVGGVISSVKRGPTPPPHGFSFSRSATAMGGQGGGQGGIKSGHGTFGPHYNVAAANIGFRAASTAQTKPVPFVSGETKTNNKRAAENEEKAISTNSFLLGGPLRVSVLPVESQEHKATSISAIEIPSPSAAKATLGGVSLPLAAGVAPLGVIRRKGRPPLERKLALEMDEEEEDEETETQNISNGGSNERGENLTAAAKDSMPSSSVIAAAPSQQLQHLQKRAVELSHVSPTEEPLTLEGGEEKEGNGEDTNKMAVAQTSPQHNTCTLKEDDAVPKRSVVDLVEEGLGDEDNDDDEDEEEAVIVPAPQAPQEVSFLGTDSADAIVHFVTQQLPPPPLLSTFPLSKQSFSSWPQVKRDEKSAGSGGGSVVEGSQATRSTAHEGAILAANTNTNTNNASCINNEEERRALDGDKPSVTDLPVTAGGEANVVSLQLPEEVKYLTTLMRDDDVSRKVAAPHPPLQMTAAPQKGAVGVATVSLVPLSTSAAAATAGRRPQSAGIGSSSVWGAPPRAPPPPSSLPRSYNSSYAILEEALLAKAEAHQNPPRRHSSSSAPPFVFSSSSTLFGLQSVTQKEAKSESVLGSTAMAFEAKQEWSNVGGGVDRVGRDARKVSIARYFPAMELQTLEENERAKVVNEYLSGLFGGELEALVCMSHEEEGEGEEVHGYDEGKVESGRAKKEDEKPRTLGTTPSKKAEKKSLEVEVEDDDDDSDMQVGPRFASKTTRGTLSFFNALAGGGGRRSSSVFGSKSTTEKAKVEEGGAPIVSSDAPLPISDDEGARQEEQRSALSLSSSSSFFSTIVHLCVFSEEAHFRECLEAYRDVHWQTLAFDEIEMRELAARESLYQLFLFERELLGESQFIVLEQKCRATIVREHVQWLEKVMTFVNAPPSEEAILEAVCSGSLSERAAALIIEYHGRMGHLDEFVVDGSVSDNNFWGLMLKRMREAEAAENVVRRRLSLFRQTEGSRRNKKKKGDTSNSTDSPLGEDQSDLGPVGEGDRKRKALRHRTRKADVSPPTSLPTSPPSNTSPNHFNETPSRRNKKGAANKGGKSATTRVSSSSPKKAGAFSPNTVGHTSSHLLLEDYLRLFPLASVSPYKQSPPPPFKVAAVIDRTINNVTPAFEKAVAEREKDRQRKRLEAIAERLNGINESLSLAQQQHQHQNGETGSGRVGDDEEGNEERRPKPSRPSTANHSFNRLSSRAGGAPSFLSSARPASALRFRFESPSSAVRSPSSSSGVGVVSVIIGGKGDVRPTRPFTSPSAYRKDGRHLPDANRGDKGEGKKREGPMGVASRQRQLVSPQPRAPLLNGMSSGNKKRKTTRNHTSNSNTNKGSDVEEEEDGEEVDARVLASTNPPHLLHSAKRVSEDDASQIYDDISDSSSSSSSSHTRSADKNEHQYGPRVGKALKGVLEDFRFLDPNPSRTQIQRTGDGVALHVNTANDPTTSLPMSAPRNGATPGLGEFIKRARSGSIQSTASVRSSSAVTATTAAVPVAVDLDSFFMPSLPPSQRDGWRPNGSNSVVGGPLKRSVSQQGMHRINQDSFEGEGRQVSTPSPSPYGVVNMNTRAQTESQGRGVSNSRRTSLSPTPPPPIPLGSYLPPPAAVRMGEEGPGGGTSSRRSSVSSTAPPQPSLQRRSSSSSYIGRPLAFGAPVPTREKSYREELEDHMRSGGHLIGIAELGGLHAGGGGALNSRRPSAATMSRRGSTAGGAVSGIGSSSSGDETGGGGAKRARRTRSGGNKQLGGALTIPTAGSTPPPSSPAGSTASANNASGSSPTTMGRHVQTPYFTTHFAAAPPPAVPSRTTSSSSLSRGGRANHAGSTKAKTDNVLKGGGDAASSHSKSDLWSTEAVARREVDLRAGAAEDRVMLRSRSSGLGGRALGLRASLFAGLEANAAAHHSSRPTSSSNNQQREGRVAYRRRSSAGVSPPPPPNTTTTSKEKSFANLSSLSSDESASSSGSRRQRRVSPPAPTLGEIRVTKKELDRASEDPKAAVQPSSIEQYTYIVPQTLFEYFIEQKRMYDDIIHERADARRRVRAAAEKRLADETEAARAKFFFFKELEEKRKQKEGVVALQSSPTRTFPLLPSIAQCVKLMELAGEAMFSADVSPDSSSNWMWHFIFFKTLVSKRHKALVMVSDVSGWLLPCLSVVATMSMSMKLPCTPFPRKGHVASPPKLMSARLSSSASSSSHHIRRHPMLSSSGSSLLGVTGLVGVTSQKARKNTQNKTPLEENETKHTEESAIDRGIHGVRTPSRNHRGGSRDSSTSSFVVSTTAPATPSKKKKSSLVTGTSTDTTASESIIQRRSFPSKLFSQLLASHLSREEVLRQRAEMEEKEEEREEAAARYVYALIVAAGHRYLRLLDERSPTRREYHQSSADESLNSYMYM